MRTKKIKGVTYIHRDDYRESPGFVVDCVLIDSKLKKIVGNMRMAASRRKSLNKKLQRRRLTERWVPALYKDKEEVPKVKSELPPSKPAGRKVSKVKRNNHAKAPRAQRKK